ncbi:hypothetical protein NKH18_01735 [Streptomyces sp. M10(2022)]
MGQEEADNAMPSTPSSTRSWTSSAPTSNRTRSSSRRSNPCDSPRPADSTPTCCTCCPAIDKLCPATRRDLLAANAGEQPFAIDVDAA